MSVMPYLALTELTDGEKTADNAVSLSGFAKQSGVEPFSTFK